MVCLLYGEGRNTGLVIGYSAWGKSSAFGINGAGRDLPLVLMSGKGSGKGRGNTLTVIGCNQLRNALLAIGHVVLGMMNGETDLPLGMSAGQ